MPDWIKGLLSSSGLESFAWLELFGTILIGLLILIAVLYTRPVSTIWLSTVKVEKGYYAAGYLRVD